MAWVFLLVSLLFDACASLRRKGALHASMSRPAYADTRAEAQFMYDARTERLFSLDSRLWRLEDQRRAKQNPTSVQGLQKA